MLTEMIVGNNSVNNKNDNDNNNSSLITKNNKNNETNYDDFELNHIYNGINKKKKDENEWWNEHNQSYAGNYNYLLYYCLERQIKLTYRDLPYIKGSLIRTIIVASIAASLFRQLPINSSSNMTGIIYFSCMQNAISGLSKLL